VGCPPAPGGRTQTRPHAHVLGVPYATTEGCPPAPVGAHQPVGTSGGCPRLLPRGAHRRRVGAHQPGHTSARPAGALRYYRGVPTGAGARWAHTNPGAPPAGALRCPTLLPRGAHDRRRWAHTNPATRPRGALHYYRGVPTGAGGRTPTRPHVRTCALRYYRGVPTGAGARWAHTNPATRPTGALRYYRGVPTGAGWAHTNPATRTRPTGALGYYRGVPTGAGGHTQTRPHVGGVPYATTEGCPPAPLGAHQLVGTSGGCPLGTRQLPTGAHRSQRAHPAHTNSGGLGRPSQGCTSEGCPSYDRGVPTGAKGRTRLRTAKPNLLRGVPWLPSRGAQIRAN